MFNPERLALIHDPGKPRGCFRSGPWNPGGGPRGAVQPQGAALCARAAPWRPPSCFPAPVGPPPPSGWALGRPARPFTMDPHHRPQQAPGMAEWFIRRDCKRYFKSKFPYPAVSCTKGRQKGQQPMWPLHSWQRAPSSLAHSSGRSWVSQTMPILRTPAVHLIALKAGSLSAPVIDLFGRRKQGQRQMRLINTLFLQCTISLSEMLRGYWLGCLFGCETDILNCPNHFLPWDSWGETFKFGQWEISPVGREDAGMIRPGLFPLCQDLEFCIQFFFFFLHPIARLALRAVWPDPGLKGSEIAWTCFLSELPTHQDGLVGTQR